MVDERLLDTATRGDRNARGELLRLAQDRWFRFAVSILGDPELARDAVQEAAVRVLERLNRFDRRSTFLTWSLGIVLNVCREMRRQRRHVSIEPGHESGADADPTLERNEAVQHLRLALEHLPERQREAVVLRFFEELSVEETARAMNCAPGTVKATVHQALRAMREKLSGVQ
jgi:RNA polymerase sigma-70 factor (ECF subfamily)